MSMILISNLMWFDLAERLPLSHDIKREEVSSISNKQKTTPTVLNTKTTNATGIFISFMILLFVQIYGIW